MANRTLVLIVIVALAYSSYLEGRPKVFTTSPLVVNKNWSTLSSKHFLLHIPTSRVQDGKQYVLFFEEVHAKISANYGQDIHHQPTNVILIYTRDQANALAQNTAGPGPNRIVITMYSGRQASELGNYDSYFRLVFIHEYAHILSLRTQGSKYPLLQALRVFFGVPFKALYPIGITEGIATWQEGQLQKDENLKGRITGSIARMYIRTASLRDTYPTLSEVLYSTHRWPWAGIPYIWGAQMFVQLQIEHGEDAIPKFWSADGGGLFPSIDFRRAGGSIRGIYKTMKARHDREAARVARQIQKNPLSRFTRLTYSGAYKNFLYLTPKGDLLYHSFLANRKLGVYRASGAQLQSLRQVKNKREARKKRPKLLFPSISVTGMTANEKYFLVSKNYESANLSPFIDNNDVTRQELFYVKVGNGRATARAGKKERLSPNRYISYPALSKSSDRLYYVERDHEFKYLKTTLLDPEDLRLPASRSDSSSSTRVGLSKQEFREKISTAAPVHPQEQGFLKVPLFGILEDVAVHPLNANIVAVSVRASANQGYPSIVLCRRRSNASNSGYNCKKVVGGKSKKAHLSFTQDGKQILFSADVTGVFNIYSYSLVSGVVRRLTNTVTGYFTPQQGKEENLYAIKYFENGFDIVFIAKKDLQNVPVPGFGVTQSFREDLQLQRSQEQRERNKILKLEANYFQVKPYRSKLNAYLPGIFAVLGTQAFTITLDDPLQNHQLNVIIGSRAAQNGGAPFLWLGFRYGYNVQPTNFIWGHDQIAKDFLNMGDISYTADRLAGVHQHRLDMHRTLFSVGQQYEKNHTPALAGRNEGIDVAFYERTISYFNILVANTVRFPASISPELGYTFNFGFEYRITNPLPPSLRTARSRSTSTGTGGSRATDQAGQTDQAGAADQTNQAAILDANFIPNQFTYNADFILGIDRYLPGFADNHVNLLGAELLGSLNNRRLQQASFTYEYRLPLAWFSADLAQNTKADPGFVRVSALAMRLVFEHSVVFFAEKYTILAPVHANSASVIFSLLLELHTLPVVPQINIRLTRAPANLRSFQVQELQIQDSGTFLGSDTGSASFASVRKLDPYEYQLGIEFTMSIGDHLHLVDGLSNFDRPAITRVFGHNAPLYRRSTDNANGLHHYKVRDMY